LRPFPEGAEFASSSAAAQPWVTAYLSVLGLEPQPPSLDFLRKLTRAHVLRIPFENITSILRRASAGEADVAPLDRHSVLQSWATRRGGGVCFEVVDMVGALLDALGFEQHAVLATISFVGSHQANLVTLNGARYLVDAGNGAPFFEPIPILPDGTPIEVHHAGLSYRFRPSEGRAGSLVQERWVEAQWRPFCTYPLAPAAEAGRKEAYRRHHTRGQSWVVDSLTLIRSTETEVWSLRDDRVTHYTAEGKQTFELGADVEYERMVAETFDLPAAPVADALKALARES
jgi:N-hydroxyarylamine O-acetyltransferase